MNKTPVPHIFLRKDHTLHTSKNTRMYDNLIKKKTYKIRQPTVDGVGYWQRDTAHVTMISTLQPYFSCIIYPERNGTKTIKSIYTLTNRLHSRYRTINHQTR